MLNHIHHQHLLREPSFEALIAWPPSLNFDVTMLIITDPSVSKVSMAIVILEMCTIHNKYDQVTPVITYQLILDTSCVVGYMIFVTFLRFISSQVFMKDFSESFLISELYATNYKYITNKSLLTWGCDTQIILHHDVWHFDINGQEVW